MNSKKLFSIMFRLALLLLVLVMITGCDNSPPEDVEKSAVTDVALCEPHQLPVSDCFMCDPALRDQDRLWCTEHDRYEDRCFICHPELN